MGKENPKNLKYTREHEWVNIEGDMAVCGITDHAQELMTEIVYVELPDLGNTVRKGDKLASLESVKSVSEVYAPLSGKITEINEATEDDPGLVNRDAFGDGWIFKFSYPIPEKLIISCLSRNTINSWKKRHELYSQQ